MAMRHPRETVGIVMAGAATIVIFVNALFLQNGPHPAPIFASHPLVHAHKVVLPPVRVLPPAAPSASAASNTGESGGQLVADIQQALQRKGFYDGTIDGIWGARTDAAVRDFEQKVGMKLDVQPSDGLLRAIKRSSAHAKNDASPPHSDPIARLLTPTSRGPQPSAGAAASSKQILAVQHALADFGYGQIKPTGVLDADTSAAIEKFERERGLPITDKLTDQFVRELAAMTGRPLE